jgi:flavodoxin
MKPIQIMYGSVTGNSRIVAERLQNILEELGYSSEIHTLFGFTAEKIDSGSKYIFILSTWSKGTLNENTVGFYESLYKSSLTGLNYGLIGLGEMKYGDEYFCKAVDIIQEEFDKLGANSLTKSMRVEDYDGISDEKLSEWVNSIL